MAKWSNLAAFPVHSKTFNWIWFKVAATVHPTVHEFCNFVEKSRPVIWIFSHRQVVLTYDPSACDSKKVHTLTHWHTHTRTVCKRVEGKRTQDEVFVVLDLFGRWWEHKRTLKEKKTSGEAPRPLGWAGQNSNESQILHWNKMETWEKTTIH